MGIKASVPLVHGKAKSKVLKKVIATGDRVENFANDFRIRSLEANATTHIDSQKYREALGSLAELRKLQSNENAVAKVHTMVMEGLCYLRLSEDSAASEVNQKIVQTVTLSNLTPDDITEMAKALVEEGKHARAYFLYYAACKLCLVKEEKYAAWKIGLTMNDMQVMTKEMVNLLADKIVVARHMVPAMKKIVEELVAMPDNGSNKKIEHQAWCYSYIGRCYNYLGDKEQELAMNIAGINVMNEKLGNEAEKYRVTGICYNNAGFAYKTLGQKDKAISAYNSAIRSYGGAADFASEQEKHEAIERSMRDLKLEE